MNGPLVLKLGGELIETPADRRRIGQFVASASADRPIAVIHGGGKAIDAELGRRGIQPKKVDGLRITDDATLEAVVAVLAGSANTDLVAALVAEGVAAVGLSGVDAGLGQAVRSPAQRATSGQSVDLGLVGDPANVDASLIELLLVHGYVPVLASLGIETASDPGGRPAQILNVNADVMACRIAAALGGSELVIAGTTPGVLDDRGASIRQLDAGGVDTLIAAGTATAGMVAKLRACRDALNDGVVSIRLIDGRLIGPDRGLDDLPGTVLSGGTPSGEAASPSMGSAAARSGRSGG